MGRTEKTTDAGGCAPPQSGGVRRVGTQTSAHQSVRSVRAVRSVVGRSVVLRLSADCSDCALELRGRERLRQQRRAAVANALLRFRRSPCSRDMKMTGSSGPRGARGVASSMPFMPFASITSVSSTSGAAGPSRAAALRSPLRRRAPLAEPLELAADDVAHVGLVFDQENRARDAAAPDRGRGDHVAPRSRACASGRQI